MTRFLIDLIRKKIAIPGNEPVDVSGPRLLSLQGQLKTRLLPVLRKKDFEEFDLTRATNTILQIAEAIAKG